MTPPAPRQNGHRDPAAVSTARPVVLVRIRPGTDDEPARLVHLIPLPPPSEQAGASTALCGALLRADQIEAVTAGTGTPCTLCAATHSTPTPDRVLDEPDPAPATENPAATLLRAAADYRAWDWPVTLRRDQIRLTLQHLPVAVITPTALATQVATILQARRCPPAMLIHPYAPAHRILLAGDQYGVTLPWPPGTCRITGTLLLPPSTTPRGPVQWVHPPTADTLRLTREIDLFAAIRTALHPPATGQT